LDQIAHVGVNLSRYLIKLFGREIIIIIITIIIIIIIIII